MCIAGKTADEVKLEKSRMKIARTISMVRDLMNVADGLLEDAIKEFASDDAVGVTEAVATQNTLEDAIKDLINLSAVLANDAASRRV